MTVEHVEVLVEEPSTEAALAILLPKIIGPTSFAIHPHQGTHDLLAKLPAKLRAYAHWIPDNMKIIVVVDRDDDDCNELKQRLETMASDAGIITRTVRPGAWTAVNRLAIEELEAWYFGDWGAVRSAYPNADQRVPRQASYRHPDQIAGGTWEAFERVMQRAGYFAGGLRKIEAARAIAAHMDPAVNASPSFCAFRDTLGDAIDG